MTNKAGSAIWWDGSIHRTVVDRFAVQDGVALNLTAPDNRLLPTFPLSEEAATTQGTAVSPAAAPIDAAVGPIVAPPAQPISLTKPTHAVHRPNYAAFTATCAVCVTACDDHVCNTCDDAALLLAEPSTKQTLPVPSMTVVLNLFGGIYASTDNISAKVRGRSMGVIDLDNDEQTGGGAAADITANSCFSFAIALIDANLIAGAIAAPTLQRGLCRALPRPGRRRHEADAHHHPAVSRRRPRSPA